MPLSFELAKLLDNGPEATDATLAAIGARTARRRARRLRAVTASALLLGLAGAGVGIDALATRTSFPSVSAGRAMPRHRNATAWTKRSQPLGSAPKGLVWAPRSSSSPLSTESGANAPSAASTPALCTLEGCPGTPVAFGSLTRLFDRTDGDVTVRAFRESLAGVGPLPMIPSGTSKASGATSSSSSSENCPVSFELVVEVSNPAAIGSVMVPSLTSEATSSGPFDLIDSSVVGVAESSPIEVVAVSVGADVAFVQARFADGATDEMAVVDGWAVLVDDGSGPLPASLEALDQSGASLGSATVSSDAAIAEPSGCLVALAPSSGASSPASSGRSR